MGYSVHMHAADHSRQFDAVLCDFDGVIRHWDGVLATVLETEFELPPGSITRTAFADALLAPAITGASSHEEWLASLANALRSEHGKDVDEAVRRWGEPTGSIDEAMLHTLDNLRSTGVPVVLVTNATSRLEDDLARLGIAGAFDAIANSARLGSAKPDSKIYLEAARMAQAELHRCLFIDDLEENVAAASRLGMQSIHFTGIETVAWLGQ